jgi:hypothetical protein
MDLQWFEIGLHKTSPILAEANGHCRTENGQSLVESNHLLLVQPQERPIHELGDVPCLRLDDEVTLKRGKKLSKGCFRQEIRAPLPRR